MNHRDVTDYFTFAQEVSRQFKNTRLKQFLKVHLQHIERRQQPVDRLGK
jgi:hypothetical protein